MLTSILTIFNALKNRKVEGKNCFKPKKSDRKIGSFCLKYVLFDIEIYPQFGK